MKTKCLYHWDLFSKMKNTTYWTWKEDLKKHFHRWVWVIKSRRHTLLKYFVWSLPPLKIECENTTLYLTFPNQWQIYPSHPKWFTCFNCWNHFEGTPLHQIHSQGLIYHTSPPYIPYISPERGTTSQGTGSALFKKTLSQRLFTKQSSTTTWLTLPETNSKRPKN